MSFKKLLFKLALWLKDPQDKCQQSLEQGFNLFVSCNFLSEMEVTSATSTSYDEVIANGASIDEIIFPNLFLPLVEKASFSSAPLGSGFMIVDLRDDGSCVIQAVYKKLAASGVLIKAIESSSFPTIVFFVDVEATILLLTEEGKAPHSCFCFYKKPSSKDPFSAYLIQDHQPYTSLCRLLSY